MRPSNALLPALITLMLVSALETVPALSSSALAQDDVLVREGVVAVARPATHLSTLTGFTRAASAVTLVSEVSGRVLDVMAEVGDPIGEDGVFAAIDDTFVRLELAANQAEQAKLASQAAYLQKEVDRYRDLVSRDSAAQSTLDELQQRFDQVRLSRQSLRVEEETIAERLKRHQVIAPRDYLVMTRLVEPGDWVAVGQPLATVGLFDTLDVPFALSPEEFAALEATEGMLSLRLPDRSRSEAMAEIHTVSPAFDPETRKINVTLRIVSMEGDPRGGLRAELELPIPDPSGVVLLPEDFVTTRYDDHWVLRENGERVKVTVLGPGPDGTTRIASDEIRPGDRFSPDSP